MATFVRKMILISSFIYLLFFCLHSVSAVLVKHNIAKVEITAHLIFYPNIEFNKKESRFQNCSDIDIDSIAENILRQWNGRKSDIPEQINQENYDFYVMVNQEKKKLEFNISWECMELEDVIQEAKSSVVNNLIFIEVNTSESGGSSNVDKILGNHMTLYSNYKSFSCPNHYDELGVSQTAPHEFGHLLGLSHNDEQYSGYPDIMDPCEEHHARVSQKTIDRLKIDSFLPKVGEVAYLGTTALELPADRLSWNVPNDHTNILSPKLYPNPISKNTCSEISVSWEVVNRSSSQIRLVNLFGQVLYTSEEINSIPGSKNIVRIDLCQYLTVNYVYLLEIFDFSMNYINDVNFFRTQDGVTSQSVLKIIYY